MRVHRFRKGYSRFLTYSLSTPHWKSNSISVRYRRFNALPRRSTLGGGATFYRLARPISRLSLRQWTFPCCCCCCCSFMRAAAAALYRWFPFHEVSFFTAPSLSPSRSALLRVCVASLSFSLSISLPLSLSLAPKSVHFSSAFFFQRTNKPFSLSLFSFFPSSERENRHTSNLFFFSVSPVLNPYACERTKSKKKWLYSRSN